MFFLRKRHLNVVILFLRALYPWMGEAEPLGPQYKQRHSLCTFRHWSACSSWTGSAELTCVRHPHTNTQHQSVFPLGLEKQHHHFYNWLPGALSHTTHPNTVMPPLTHTLSRCFWKPMVLCLALCCHSQNALCVVSNHLRLAIVCWGLWEAGCWPHSHCLSLWRNTHTLPQLVWLTWSHDSCVSCNFHVSLCVKFCFSIVTFFQGISKILSIHCL